MIYSLFESATFHQKNLFMGIHTLLVCIFKSLAILKIVFCFHKCVTPFLYRFGFISEYVNVWTISFFDLVYGKSYNKWHSSSRERTWLVERETGTVGIIWERFLSTGQLRVILEWLHCLAFTEWTLKSRKLPNGHSPSVCVLECSLGVVNSLHKEQTLRGTSQLSTLPHFVVHPRVIHVSE